MARLLLPPQVPALAYPPQRQNQGPRSLDSVTARAISSAQLRWPSAPVSALNPSKNETLYRHPQLPLRQKGPAQALPHYVDPEHPKSFERASFLSRAACGPVECTGRGCRPLHPGEGGCPPAAQDETARASTDAWGTVLGREAEGEEAHGLCLERGEAPGGPAHSPLARLSEWLWRLSQFECQILVSDVSRRQNEGRHTMYEPEDLLSLAEYSWREMGNLDSAQLLFERVLETDPANPTALASYALFLWESEAAGHFSSTRIAP